VISRKPTNINNTPPARENMSIFSLPRGIHRKQDGDFKPNSMIDILFDYRKFLGPEFTIHKSKVSYPEYIAIIGAGAAGLFAGIL
jgi:hypothetical protein